jgi:hypothetical protein
VAGCVLLVAVLVSILLDVPDVERQQKVQEWLNLRAFPARDFGPR